MAPVADRARPSFSGSLVSFCRAVAAAAERRGSASGAPPAVKFPDIKNFTLKNGLKVAFVHRATVPVLDMSLMMNAGYAADQFGLPGLASLAGQMLTEGTATRSSLQISDELGVTSAR